MKFVCLVVLVVSNSRLPLCLLACRHTYTHTQTHSCQDIAQQRNTRNKSTKVQKKGNELNLHMLNTGSFSMCHNTHTHTHTTLGPLCNLLLGASMKWAINSAIATVVRLCKVWMWMLQRRVRKLLCSVEGIWERMKREGMSARRTCDKSFFVNRHKENAINVNIKENKGSEE